MTGKEIAELAFKLQPGPRIPVTLIAGGEWYVHQAGQTFGRIKSDAEAIAGVFIHAFEQVGHDMLWTGAGLLNYPAHCLGCPVKDDDSSSPRLLGPALSSLDQLDRLDLEGCLADPIMEAYVSSNHLVADRIGRQTLLIPTLWGPFTTAARVLGVEQLLMATVADPKGAKELIDFCARFIWRLTERIIDHPLVPGFNLSEPVASPDMISPVTFRKFVRPVLVDLVERARTGGKYSMIHICGNTTSLLEEVAEMGPTAFSLESKVDLAEAQRVLGGKVCVAGNVSPTGSFLSGSPEEVRTEARACLKAWGEDTRGYILTVGCDFPKTVPLENALALMSFKDQQRLG